MSYDYKKILEEFNSLGVERSKILAFNEKYDFLRVSIDGKSVKKIKENIEEILKKKLNINSPNVEVEKNNEVPETEISTKKIEPEQTTAKPSAGKEYKNAENLGFGASKFEYYKDSILTPDHKFIVFIPENIKIKPTVELYTPDAKNLCGHLTIERKDESSVFLITKKIEDISLNYLKNGNCKLKLFDENNNIYWLTTIVEIKEYSVFPGTLCIDFGTSNTSAGIYLDGKPQLVKFDNVLSGEGKIETIPTVIYVEDCSSKDNLKLKFGYEAKKIIKDKDFNFDGTIIYDIKNWLLSIDKKIKVYGDNNTTLEIEKKEFIRRFLEHIIQQATNQFKYKFKKLHFSTPINLKGIYIHALKIVLKDRYEIVDEADSIDEGVADLFENIMENIKTNKNPTPYKDDPRRTMIIDIGGGTTDVISYDYEYSKEISGTKLKINTYPENSNSTFGGNNITFRIFQYLKIKIAEYYRENKDAVSIDKLIPYSDIEILEKIDESIEKKIDPLAEIYGVLESEYNKACEVLPTNYSNNETFPTINFLRQIKRNFYLLWEIAEIVKIEFFKNLNVYVIDFINKDEDNRRIKVPNLDKLVFSIVKDNKIIEASNAPAISIGIKEIQKLIYADIYNLLVGVFGYEDNLIIEENYQHIKTCGQTAKINIILELLKEFMSGRNLREKKKKELENTKLNCITGSIQYMNGIDTGTIIPEICRHKSTLKYTVKVVRGTEDVVLSADSIIPQVYDTAANHAELKFYTKNGKYIKTEKYTFLDKIEGKKEQLNDIRAKIANLKIFNEDIIKEVERRFREAHIGHRIVLLLPSNDCFLLEIVEYKKTSDTEFMCHNKSVYKTFEANFDEYKFFSGRE